MSLSGSVDMMLELCSTVPNNKSEPKFYGFDPRISLGTLPAEQGNGHTDGHHEQGGRHEDRVFQLQKPRKIDTNTGVNASTKGTLPEEANNGSAAVDIDDHSEQRDDISRTLQLKTSRKADPVLRDFAGADENIALISGNAGAAGGHGGTKASAERGPTNSAYESNSTSIFVSIGSHELLPYHESIDLAREQTGVDLNASSSNSMQSSEPNTNDPVLRSFQSDTNDKSSTPSTTSGESSEGYSSSDDSTGDDKSSTPSATSGESSEGYSSTDDSTGDSKNLSQNENVGILQVIPLALKSSVNSNDVSNTEKHNLSIPCVSREMGCDSKSSGSVEMALSRVEGSQSLSSSLVHEIEDLLGLPNEQPEVNSKVAILHAVIPSKDEDIVVTGSLDGTTDNCHGPLAQENKVLVGSPTEPDANSEFGHLNDICPCNDQVVPEGALLYDPPASDSVPKRITSANADDILCHDIGILPAAKTGPAEPGDAANDTPRCKKRTGSPHSSTNGLASDAIKKSRDM
ncbi:hypothetical protein SEVIR_2G036000v4 [Setaria viridis]|uniref:Uncharacterized protein n=1 Tax=Setaria viridis TaxID=4556 RepID=A0A4U6VZE0_SETVI|nr:hypothetical protein SEVIR_2G036000v2 [Setaria viridis]